MIIIIIAILANALLVCNFMHGGLLLHISAHLQRQVNFFLH